MDLLPRVAGVTPARQHDWLAGALGLVGQIVEGWWWWWVWAWEKPVFGWVNATMASAWVRAGGVGVPVEERGGGEKQHSPDCRRRWSVGHPPVGGATGPHGASSHYALVHAVMVLVVVGSVSSPCRMLESQVEADSPDDA